MYCVIYESVCKYMYKQKMIQSEFLYLHATESQLQNYGPKLPVIRCDDIQLTMA